MVAAIADCHVPDQFNAYRSPSAVAAQGFWLFQESLTRLALVSSRSRNRFAAPSCVKETAGERGGGDSVAAAAVPEPVLPSAPERIRHQSCRRPCSSWSRSGACRRGRVKAFASPWAQCNQLLSGLSQNCLGSRLHQDLAALPGRRGLHSIGAIRLPSLLGAPCPAPVTL